MHRVCFSPTNRDFAVVTSEGLLVYSLNNLFAASFGASMDLTDEMTFVEDFSGELTSELTPARIQEEIEQGHWASALNMALALNLRDVIAIVFNRIPFAETNQPDRSIVQLVAANVSRRHLANFLEFLSTEIERSSRLEYLLEWVRSITMFHGQFIRQNPDKLGAPVRDILRCIAQNYEDIAQMAQTNAYHMEFLALQRSASNTAAFLSDNPAKRLQIQKNPQ